MPTIKSLWICLALLFFCGCASLTVKNYQALFGPATPKEFYPVTQPIAIEYERDIRPVLEKRCVVCHGCYDAPCQLKMESYEGILRGASKTPVYYATRLSEARPSRLYEDAHSTAEWRTKSFFPVLNEHANTTVANLQASVISRMLDLKQAHPLPEDPILPSSFDFSLERNQQCAKIEEFDDFASKYPLWGMPYGLPAISQDEHDLIQNWLKIGAPSAEPKPLSQQESAHLSKVESFLNQSDLKHQLVARYLYEHLFLAHLYFDDQGKDTRYFKLVRSSTPPGQPIQTIATRRPYDDPGTNKLYYRLWLDPSSIVAKTHMPYRLDKARLQKWDDWFIRPDYEVSKLPDYSPKTASNPFITFQTLPLKARYHFLLDEAQFTVMNFIKGPVCRGSMALNVIQDHFWVFFTDPDNLGDKAFSQFLAAQDKHLRMPAEFENNLWSIRHWNDYSTSQLNYLKAKGAVIEKYKQNFSNLKLKTFWDGDQTNPNAALTVFRHYDSASVVKGLVGKQPETVWLIDYPILERIHYLLVAGYDVFGPASHQVMTRLYMDFLRMESEMNFVMFLPEAHRIKEISQWYRGAHESVDRYLNAYLNSIHIDDLHTYKTQNYKHELLETLRTRLKPVLDERHSLKHLNLSESVLQKIDTLQNLKGMPATILPQTLVLQIENHGVMTLLSNSHYTNISSILGEADRREEKEDTITVANGIIGAYPSVFMKVKQAQLDEFLRLIITLSNEEDYQFLLERFGVRRTHPQFWQISDQIHDYYQNSDPLHSGILDYNRYDNR